GGLWGDAARLRVAEVSRGSLVRGAVVRGGVVGAVGPSLAGVRPAERARAVLLDQARRHRSRPAARPRDRRGPRRPHRPDQPPRRRPRRRDHPAFALTGGRRPAPMWQGWLLPAPAPRALSSPAWHVSRARSPR